MADKKPVAKATCLDCGDFFIWDAKLITITFRKGELPLGTASCPQCKNVVENDISFKTTLFFADKGAVVTHDFDDKKDLMPFTEEDVNFFLEHFEDVMKGVLDQ